eukprot:sb/3463044/
MRATGRVNPTRGGGRGGRGMYHPSGTAVHYCEVCKVTCGTNMTYKAHLEGSKHIKKAAAQKQAPLPNKETQFKCGVCEVVSVSAEAFKAHINGGKHQKKVQLLRRLGKPIPENVTPAVKEGEEEESSTQEKVGEELMVSKFDTNTNRTVFHCTMCDCSVMDGTARDFHLSGRRHRLEYKKKYDKTLRVDLPASKRQRIGAPAAATVALEKEQKKQMKSIWDAEQRQLESEWTQYREEERWFRYLEGVKRQEDEQKQWYFEEKARCESLGIAPPAPPARPRPPPPPPSRDNSRKLLECMDSSLIQKKHASIQPSKDEIGELEKLMKSVEQGIEIVSGEMEKEEVGGGTEPTGEKRFIKSWFRMGDLPKHSILKGYIEGGLAVFTLQKPTDTILNTICTKLEAHLKGKGDTENTEMTADPTNCCFVINRSQPEVVQVRVNITSTAFTEDGETPAALPYPGVVLNQKHCILTMAQVRQTKWFETKMSVNLIVVLQLLKDLNKRIPAWAPLSVWSLELMVERCARTKGFSPLPPGRPHLNAAEVLKRVFELVASGLVVDGPGLNDPCEKVPVDVLAHLTRQEREDLTACAQYALRLMIFNQLYKILGIPRPTPAKLNQLPPSVML